VPGSIPANLQEHVRLSHTPSGRDYLSIMTRAIFQAGLSWAAIDAQWAALCDAFDGFDPAKVAKYGDADVRRIMAHPGIVHSERKIRATIRNAQTLLDLTREHGTFRKYLRAHNNYAALADAMKQRFAYLGDISLYYFLYRVGERVPPFARWMKTVEGDHPRIKEMVSARR
jgi:3-methyladenine DNA glycosylase/8-oxoguanine DNA glycosylase